MLFNTYTTCSAHYVSLKYKFYWQRHNLIPVNIHSEWMNQEVFTKAERLSERLVLSFN